MRVFFIVLKLRMTLVFFSSERWCITWMSRVVSCKFKNVSVTFLRIIALTKSHRRNIGIDNNHFLTGILYLYIMSTGYISLYIIFIMLITTIRQICSQENNFSRRDVLIQTLKNVEKQARYEERLAFLCQCRRSRVFPMFIQSLDGFKIANDPLF